MMAENLPAKQKLGHLLAKRKNQLKRTLFTFPDIAQTRASGPHTFVSYLALILRPNQARFRDSRKSYVLKKCTYLKARLFIDVSHIRIKIFITLFVL